MTRPKEKNKAVMAIMAMVGVFFIVLVIFSIYTVNVFQNQDKSLGFGKKSGDKIGVIEINGVIMKSKDTIKLIHKAEKDKDVKAIVMRINSPGGAVAPTQEIYNEIRRIDEAYTTSNGEKSKPVYASFGSVAASGGYYLGAATRKICALPGTITGSIGVIMQFMDLSKLYKWAMLNPQTIKAGRYKDIGQPTRSLTDEEKSIMDTMIKGVHKQFITDINKTRSKKIKGDINEHAQGQIFSGESAHELGLVDELSGLWGCARNIHKNLELKGETDLKYIKKKKKMKFVDLLTDLEQASSALKDMVESVESPILMFK